MTAAFQVLPAEARAAVYSLLSRALLREVDVAFLEQLRRPEIAGVLSSLEPGVRPELDEAARSEARREDLDVEYCRLFVLPGGVSPYALAWMGGEAGATRARLQTGIGGLLDDLALRPADHGLGNLPLDHVGVLLALAAVAEGRDPGGPAAAEVLAVLQPWAGRFAAALARSSERPLYRALARLLAAVLDG